MRNFAILIFLVGIISFLSPHRTVLERIDLESSVTLEFDGTFFLPRTLPKYELNVKDRFATITLAGKNYRYVDCFSGFCLSNDFVREVPVKKGDVVSSTIPAKLFFLKVL